VLFGDGAAAVILEATTQKAGILSTILGSRGDVERSLSIEAGGSACPASAQTVADKAHYICMRGNEVFRLAVRQMTQVAQQAILKAGLSLNDIHAVVPHQDALVVGYGTPPDHAWSGALDALCRALP